MKIPAFLISCLLAYQTSKASVVASWTESDIEAARQWLSSMNPEESIGRGGIFYTTLEPTVGVSASTFCSLAIGGESGSLAIYGTGDVPANLALIFDDPTVGPSSLISILSSDFTIATSNSSDSTTFSFAGVFPLASGQWRLLGNPDRLSIYVDAGNSSTAVLPLHAASIPETHTAIYGVFGIALLLRRVRHAKST